MWYNTKAAGVLGIQYPILQGPFGGNLSTVQLAATVSNLGGLGGYGAYTLSPDEIINIDQQIKAATSKPYNINLWVSNSDVPSGGITDAVYENTKALFKPYFDELGIPLPPKPSSLFLTFEDQAEALLTTRPPAFSFMFGIPSQTLLDEFRKRDIAVMGAATTLDEAVALENAGVDLIIASGFEAGGHRPSFLDKSENSLMGTFALLQVIKEKVKTPIIAAGGIANGKGIAAALALGASAVQVGTAFLVTEESNITEFYRQTLLSYKSNHTILTRAFTGRLGRGIRNRVSSDAIGKEAELLPFPLQTQFMSSLRKAAFDKQQTEMILFWSGQIAPVLKHTKAADLMQSLITETNDYFNQTYNN
ncbi:nitronate monooxygenase [Mucilaginibacter sp. CAU 1740]|uniref:NAD(P)H-dependent flavin oxidoreductase n=1 Tax=Mucilaginibacter sp. CAU 1740 TaxID=3140365 RepID=UPI00325A7C0B